MQNTSNENKSELLFFVSFSMGGGKGRGGRGGGEGGS